MKINIQNSKGIIKEVELNEYLTIGKAKEKANEIGNQWMFNGEILGDDKTLLDYDIEDGDTIFSISQNIPGNFRIRISNTQGNEKTVEVNLNMTIKEAKKKCNDIGRNWVFDGERLHDEKTFEYYCIEEGDCIKSIERILGGLIQEKII